MTGRKNTSARCRGFRPSWALVGARCSNQIQAAQGQVLARDCTLVQAAIASCILLLLVSKMVLTLCNLCCCLFQSSANIIEYIAYTHGAHHLQLALVFLCQITHLLMCTNTWVHIVPVVVIDCGNVSYCGEICTVWSFLLFVRGGVVCMVSHSFLHMWVMSTNVYISMNPAVSAHSLASMWQRT